MNAQLTEIMRLITNLIRTGSLPVRAYQVQPVKTDSPPPVIRYEINAPIHITAQPDIAREVGRQLDERERRARAKARSKYSDQGGYDS